MSKKDYDLEQRAEDILKAFAMEMGKNNEAFAQAVLDENQPDPPLYAEVEERAETDAAVELATGDANPEAPVRPHRSRRVLRRTLILAAVLILMMGLVVCTSEGVRLKLSSLFFGDAPGSTRVLDDSNLVVDLEKVELGYVPEGFEVVSDEILMGYCRMIELNDEKGNIILLSITKTEQYVYNIDNETNSDTTIRINDKQGSIFFDGEQNVVIWQIGDCTFDIASSFEKDNLITIAEHITVQ